MDLTEEVLKDRLAAYARLRGGYTVPMAGIVYWAAIGAAGYVLEPQMWNFVAFVTSGMIFPLALVFSHLFRNNFMKDKTATGSVLAPAFIGMLLFWPMAIAAYRMEPQLVPLILAIGMSMHWPTIGWSYGRTAIFSAHAIVRALAVMGIWFYFPEQRFTWLPLAVAAIYVVTVLVLWIDLGMVKKRLAAA